MHRITVKKFQPTSDEIIWASEVEGISDPNDEELQQQNVAFATDAYSAVHEAFRKLDEYLMETDILIYEDGN